MKKSLIIKLIIPCVIVFLYLVATLLATFFAPEIQIPFPMEILGLFI